jgi:hypothetical protein
LALLAAAAPDVRAHIGSPNVYFTGNAGPYPVRVVIRPPLAVPGRAEVNVTVEGDGVKEVRLVAAPPGVPPETLPAPELARPVAGAAGLHAAELWIMVSGAYGIRVVVSGARGDGEAVVPLNAVNQAPAAMAAWLRASLLVLAIVLGAGAVLIASAAARESTLAPGAVPAAPDRRRGTLAGAAAAAAVVAVAVLGFTAWRRMDRDYRSNQLFEPLPIAAQAQVVGSGRRVTLRPTPDERGRAEWPPLVTDHGKLMHLFLVRERQLDAFAHLHPRREGGDFAVAVPPLPGGTYRIYADVTLESGLSQTLTTTVTLPEPPPTGGTGADPPLVADPDDSWHVAAAPPGQATTVPLARGYRMTWKNPEVTRRAGEARLEFEVLDPEGRPAHLGDYMGMRGHAAIRREDGAVFAHLHPTGSISMASQMLFEAASAPRSGEGAVVDHGAHGAGHSEASMSRVAFPYAFPRPGPYRIWVQVKPGDTVMTAVFDAQVTAADSD